MSAINKIIKHRLESRARELRDDLGKSTWEIADILSRELGEKITQSSVHRYFTGFDHEKKEAIEKRAELVARVADAEISTIEDRQTVITGLLDIAKAAKTNGNLRTAVEAYKVATMAFDSLDKRLGKISPTQNNNNLFLGVPQPPEANRLRDRMKVYDAIFEDAK
jgi:predicted transcriptional regulator